MAKTPQMTYPLDQPHLQKPGVLYVEANAPGNGKWLSLEPSNPIRAKKGDLGLEHIKDFESRPLTGSLPWANLRSGKVK